MARPGVSVTKAAGRTIKTAPRKSARRWLLLVHQLPSTPSNLRVRTWRRLQQLGAIPVKQAVYVLPDSPSAREDFEWLKTEIEGAGGQATVFAADSVDAWAEDELVAEFRRSRQEAYAVLARDVERAGAPSRPNRRGRARRANTSRVTLEKFRQRLAAIQAVDFFGSAGHDRVLTLLEQFEEHLTHRAGRQSTTPPAGQGSEDVYRRRLWVTRPRPGIDRMACAWLIKRFIDSEARFGFAPDREAVPRDAIPFDMFGVEFSHHGEHCTFETLCSTFRLGDPAVNRLAAIVHDLDLKEDRFRPPEAPTVATVIEGLQLVHSDDHVLLDHGIGLFEALYRSFQQSARPSGPRPVLAQRASRRHASPSALDASPRPSGH